MARTHAYDRPLTIEVIDGEVVMLSPDGPLGISLTADAAAQTAVALAEAAHAARAYSWDSPAGPAAGATTGPTRNPP